MGVKIEEFNFAATRGGGYGHPWEEWTDGSIWKVQKGVDYEGITGKFRDRLYKRGKDHGMRVQSAIVTEDGNEFVVFQFTPIEQS